MKIAHKMSLRIKTILIAMITASLALATSGVFISLYNYKIQQEKATQENTVIATILADRSTAALEFFDEQLATENLNALTATTSMTLACLYDAENELFALYQRPSYTRFQCPPSLPLNSIHSGDQYQETRQLVILDEAVIGTLVLVADMGNVQETIFLHIAASMIIMFITLFFTFLLAMRLQSFVTAPIQKLQDTVNKIRQSDNYSLRAEKTTEDELGELVDAFNGMVEKIETDNEALRANEERFRTLTASSPIGVFQTDADGQFTYVNARWREITNIYDILLTQEAWVKTLHPEERFQVLNGWQESISKGEEFRMEYRLLRDDGQDVNVICNAKPLYNSNDEISGYLGSLSDISELKSVQSQLEQLALYDPLTKLANRHLFRNRLEKAIKNASRDNTRLAVLFLDIDHFKKINDTMGHDQGDELLKAIAHRLRFCTRSGDTVARMGGDEFTILIPEIAHAQEADAIARKVLDVLKVPIRLTGIEVIITTSIGITIGLNDAQDASTLLKNADLAMYRAKSQGRDNYQFFCKEMNMELTRQLAVEAEIRRAIDQEEFELYYQPKIELSSGELIGFEALIRWNHPDQGLVSPAEFIPVAEDSGLILQLGEWVLKTACEQIKEFTSRGILKPNGRIAVNISPRQFHDANLGSVIKEFIQSSGIESHQLEIEITESLLMDNMDATINTLNSLKKLGVILAIDDFGTGYSSLNYLKRLPIHVLKVDRSFVTDIPADKDDMEITAAVIAMAHKLGLKVVAEGVELASQAEFLRENKCDYVQGFYFGEPMSVKRLAEVELNFDWEKQNS